MIYFIRLFEKESDNRKKEIDAKKRISRILSDELVDALNDEKETITTHSASSQSKEITYVNEFFNADMYDSLKFSGKLSFLDYELQQKIQNIFHKLKYHDKYLDRINIIDDNLYFFNSNPLYTKDNNDAKNKHFDTVVRYYYLLHNYENALLIEIPAMLKKLDEKT